MNCINCQQDYTWMVLFCRFSVKRANITIWKFQEDLLSLGTPKCFKYKWEAGQESIILSVCYKSITKNFTFSDGICFKDGW